MPSVEIRKQVTLVEEIFHEGGPVAKSPYRRAAILVVIRNPFAGRYVEDIVGFSHDLKPLGLDMANALIAALGGDPKTVEGYGKGAIVGAAGADSANGAEPSACAISRRRPLPRITARSITAASSRTLPGQG